MKRINILFFTIGLLSIVNFCIAQNNDSKAKEVLDQMYKKAKTYSTVKILFTYTVDNKDKNVHEKQNGSASIKGAKYHVLISGQEIICDSSTVWTYMKDANEVQITKAEYNDDVISPVNIFTLYQKGYKYKYQEEQIVNNKPQHVVDLFPEKSRNFFRVRLFIDKTALTITKAEVSDKKGNTYTYTITELSPNIKLDSSIFTFDKANFQGVEVVDMRE